MKKFFTTLAMLAFSLAVWAAPAESKAVKPTRDLIERIAPKHSANIELKLLPKKGGDRFELSSNGDKIVIAANNVNSLAVGFNYYLKYYCNTTVTWSVEDAVVLPEVLPAVPEKVSVKARSENRFFLNYCTYGYTMPWWTWREWERLIDWMALQGVNLPLAITGQEAVWQKVWSSFGMTDEQIRSYFTGPAHLPWHRMSNIDHWQSPLPQSWIDSQSDLQKQILARERELGMKPVLPAFAGHVPEQLAEIYPDADIKQLEEWAGFPKDQACHFLNPADKLYTEVQRRFLTTQTELYGTDHIYGVDVFNELVPPSWEPDYLASIGKKVYQSLKAVDRKAEWLQMGWLFYYMRANWTNERIEAYLGATPKDKQIILDYWAEYQEIWQMTESFFGTPFLWCYLGNFGGNTEFCGPIAKVNQRVENTYAKAGKNFVGIGSTLEGFDLNPFMFEYIFEKAWDYPIHKDVNEWTARLADRRVGKVDENARESWQLLIDSVYNNDGYYKARHWLVSRPGNIKDYGGRGDLMRANRVLLKVIDGLLKVDSNTPTYQFDVVNLTREMMCNTFEMLVQRYQKAYNEKNVADMMVFEDKILTLLHDMDDLVSTNHNFLTGKWIADARAQGTTPEEADYFESNARCLLTTWGDRAMTLNDYACRTWSGLLDTFYAERWEMMLAAAKESVLYKGEFDGPSFSKYYEAVATYEKMWWTDRIGTFNATPNEGAVEAARAMTAKYRGMAQGIYE